MTFHDVAAYFSQEEWKLLHEWQKEIYRNVMKDIQQVLLSLGPLIATSVFSLRIKEKDAVYPEEHDDFQRKPGMDHNPTGDTAVPSNIFGINREEEYLENPSDKNGSHSNAPSHTAALPSPNTDGDLRRNVASEACVTAHHDSKEKEGIPGSSSGHEASTQMIMMCIKEEEETYPLGHQDYEGSGYPLAHPEFGRSDYSLADLDYETREHRTFSTVTKISENQKATTRQSEYEDTFQVLHLEQPVPHPSEEQLTHTLESQRFPYVIQTSSEPCANSNEQVRYHQHPIYEYYEKCTAVRNPFGSDSIEFRCKCCNEEKKKTIIKVKGSTTSNLLRHIERHHHSKYALFQKAHKAYQEAKLKQNVTHPKPKCMPEVINKKKQKIFEKKDLDDSLGLIIAQDCQPLSTVENPGFVSFVSKLNSSYEIPSRKSLTYNILPKIHKDVKLEVLHELENAAKVALTFDMWTSQDHDAYFALTGHFLQQRTSVMKHFCLGVKSFPGTRTSENLVEQILLILKEYSLPLQRISSLTTDNGCNVLKAVNILGLSERHIHCMGNSFHLIVSKAIKDVASLSIVFDKCRSISKFFRNCPASNCLLKDIQIRKKLPQIKLKIDVVSRWNSIYDMVKSVLEQDIAIKAALSAATQANKISHLNIPQALTAHETKILRGVLEILGPFVIATEKLSSQSYTTSSMIIPIVTEMQASLSVLAEQHTVVEDRLVQGPRDSDSPCPEGGSHDFTVSLFCKTMKDLTYTTFENIESHSLLGKATLLDPRFKTNSFQKKDVAEFLIKELELEIQEIMNKTLSITQASECGSPPPKKKACS